MTTPENTRSLIEAIHELNTEREELFRLIAALANLLDRDVVIETVAVILGTNPVDSGDVVSFDDIAIRFDADNRVCGIYRTIDGTNPQENLVIKSDLDHGDK